MTRGRGLASAVATGVFAVGFWIGFPVFRAQRSVGLAIIAVAVVLGVYTIVALSGGEGLGDTAFRASLQAIGVALLLLLAFQITGVESLVVAAPIVSAGVGIANALEPSEPRLRVLIRVGLVIGAATIGTWVYGVDHTVYGLISPFLPVPAVLGADRLFDRGAEVVAETPSD